MQIVKQWKLCVDDDDEEEEEVKRKEVSLVL